MPVDGLTKVQGSNAALRDLMKTGLFSIRPTEEQMKRRAAAREAGQSSFEIRRCGNKEKSRSCEAQATDGKMVDPKPAPDEQLEPLGPRYGEESALVAAWSEGTTDR